MSEIENFDVCLTYAPTPPTYLFQRTVAARSEEDAVAAARVSFLQSHPGATITSTEVVRPRQRYIAQVDFLSAPKKLTRIETVDAATPDEARETIRSEFLRKNPGTEIVSLTPTTPDVRD